MKKASLLFLCVLSVFSMSPASVQAAPTVCSWESQKTCGTGTIFEQSVNGVVHHWYVSPTNKRVFALDSSTDLLDVIQRGASFVSHKDFLKIKKNRSSRLGYFILDTSDHTKHFVDRKSRTLINITEDFATSVKELYKFAVILPSVGTQAKSNIQSQPPIPSTPAKFIAPTQDQTVLDKQCREKFGDHTHYLKPDPAGINSCWCDDGYMWVRPLGDKFNYCQAWNLKQDGLKNSGDVNDRTVYDQVMKNVEKYLAEKDTDRALSYVRLNRSILGDKFTDSFEKVAEAVAALKSKSNTPSNQSSSDQLFDLQNKLAPYMSPQFSGVGQPSASDTLNEMKFCQKFGGMWVGSKCLW